MLRDVATQRLPPLSIKSENGRYAVAGALEPCCRGRRGPKKPVHWAQVEARDPSRDRQKDGERQEALKKSVFALAGSGHVDFDRLLDKVLASVPELAFYPDSVTRWDAQRKKPRLAAGA
jgi:hypothetical protein